jgi:S-ribosylhomocysteine lyase
MFQYIVKFKGNIPGATPEECGNYSDQDLATAQMRSEQYLELLKDIDESRLIYSE